MKGGLYRELISEILYRLPPKTILRLRCGSKWLCSEIDDPQFSKMHLRYSLERGSNQPLIVRSNLQFHLGEDFLNFPTEEQFLALGPTDPPLDLQLCGSCNGLVVISDFCGEAAVIWNPNTRKHRILPAPEVVHLKHDNHPTSTKFGLGYDCLSDDYKLVRIVQIYVGPFSVETSSEVTVYSFKPNAWKNIENLPHPLWHLEIDWYGAVVAHGAVHFVGTKESLLSVVAFDMHAERFRELAKLPDFGHPYYTLQDVRVLGGQLCAVFTFVRHEMEVWAIKDYGGEEESWTKLLRFHMPPDPAFPLDYSESWKKVLLPHYRRDFEWLDFERRVKPRNRKYWEYATLVVGSLVSVGGVEGENETFPESTLLQDNRWEPQPEDLSDFEVGEDGSDNEDEG